MPQPSEERYEQEDTMIVMPCDRRYRNSRYFLEDQMRYSEIVQDLRALKAFLNFNLVVNQAAGKHWQALPVYIALK